MNKNVAQMVPGDVFVDDNGIVYAIISSKYSMDHATARPCLRLTHNDHLHIEELPLTKVGRCIDRHELNRCTRDYQQSVLEHDRRERADVETSQQTINEKQCWLWMKRFRRALTDTDPTLLYSLNEDDLRALETVLQHFAILSNSVVSAHAKLDAAGVVSSSLVHRVELLIAQLDQANEATDTLKNMRVDEIHDALNRAMVPRKYNGVEATLLFRVEMLVGDFMKSKEAKVVVDGPRAKYINDALDKAGVPNTFNGNDAILFDRVEWLINQRNRSNEQLVMANDELKSAQTALAHIGVPTMVDGRTATLPERVAWLIARVGSAAINTPTKNVESSAFSEGLARINNALEQLKPVFDAVDSAVALREAMDQCSQNAATKATVDSHTRIEAECSKVRAAGRKMLRKAWESIQAALVTVGKRDVGRVEPRYEPNSLLDVYQFVQQQHKLADRELCGIDENDESKVERASYLRGLATSYVHVMALTAALGTRGFELVQYKPNE